MIYYFCQNKSEICNLFHLVCYFNFIFCIKCPARGLPSLRRFLLPHEKIRSCEADNGVRRCSCPARNASSLSGYPPPPTYTTSQPALTPTSLSDLTTFLPSLLCSGAGMSYPRSAELSRYQSERSLLLVSYGFCTMRSNQPNSSDVILEFRATE